MEHFLNIFSDAIKHSLNFNCFEATSLPSFAFPLGMAPPHHLFGMVVFPKIRDQCVFKRNRYFHNLKER